MKILKKKTVRFIDFVRPDGYWPYPYTLEQAFGVFAWMLETGRGYQDQTRWGTQTVESLLSCKPACVNFPEVEPIYSIADLRQRFHYAILSDYVGKELRSWRERFRVTPEGTATIHFSHHGFGCGAAGSEASAKDSLDALLGASGTLAVQLNARWADAREIEGVRLYYRQSAWQFVLHYGVDGSVWHHELARQAWLEPWSNAFVRAKNRLAELCKGG